MTPFCIAFYQSYLSTQRPYTRVTPCTIEYVMVHRHKKIHSLHLSLTKSVVLDNIEVSLLLNILPIDWVSVESYSRSLSSVIRQNTPIRVEANIKLTWTWPIAHRSFLLVRPLWIPPLGRWVPGRCVPIISLSDVFASFLKVQLQKDLANLAFRKNWLTTDKVVP